MLIDKMKKIFGNLRRNPKKRGKGGKYTAQAALE